MKDLEIIKREMELTCLKMLKAYELSENLVSYARNLESRFAKAGLLLTPSAVDYEALITFGAHQINLQPANVTWTITVGENKYHMSLSNDTSISIYNTSTYRSIYSVENIMLFSLAELQEKLKADQVKEEE